MKDNIHSAISVSILLTLPADISVLTLQDQSIKLHGAHAHFLVHMFSSVLSEECFLEDNGLLD